MIEVDVRGLSCPEPLMLVGQALDANPGSELKVLIDEGHTRTNVEKFVTQRGKTFETSEKGHEFEIIVR